MLGRQMVAIAGLAAGVMVSGSISAGAEERVQWKMESAFPSNLSILGEVAARFEGVIDRLSGGTLEIKFYEPGALVPTFEAFDAVKSGALDAMWGTPSPRRTWWRSGWTN